MNIFKKKCLYIIFKNLDTVICDHDKPMIIIVVLHAPAALEEKTKGEVAYDPLEIALITKLNSDFLDIMDE